jgi:hypothetical protein
MKDRTFAAAASAAVIASSLLGAGIASAHGWGAKLDPQEIADRQTAMFQEQADLLGLDVAAVKDAWSQGKDLHAIATEKGISREDLRARMDAKRKEQQKARVQALVEKGVITQAQADARLAIEEKRVSETGLGRGKEMKGGMRSGMGMGLMR